MNTAVKKEIKNILNKGKALSRKIGRVQSAVLLTIFYYTIFGIVALLTRCVKKDLLNLSWSKRDSYWLERERIDLDIERFKRQF